MASVAVASAMLRPKDASAYLGLSIATLARMRAAGGGPRFVQLYSTTVSYSRDDLDAWLSSRPRFKSTADRTVAEAGAA